jgi:hypothetical protein
MSDFLSGAHTQTTTKAGFPTGADSFFSLLLLLLLLGRKIWKEQEQKKV